MLELYEENSEAGSAVGHPPRGRLPSGYARRHPGPACLPRDLATGAYQVAWDEEGDLDRADAPCRKYVALRIGLVDAVVAAVAERLHASAIATLDLRDFAAIRIAGSPLPLSRDG